ncbi:MAG: helix-hairpin-helix domain-containing protein, partial [Chloroflexota bacterium]|nr:helix-hairpin-helix domain-containing protein [Chloroflexota bacterium]
MEQLSGSVDRVTYYNPENGYSVIRLRPKKRNTPGINRQGLVTIVGNLPQLSPGENLNLRGKWAKHPKHGLQFQAEYCEQTAPATLAGVRSYLGSGLIKGIGPKLAESIVEHFGKETLETISEHPERLSEVEKIGPKRTNQIAQAWEEQKHIKEIMLFLHSHGVSTNLATKIYKTYQDESLRIVQNNPYQLARDIYGVGFKTADKLAQDLGLEANHPSRLEAGLVYALSEKTNDGHVYLPEEELLEKAHQLLSIPVGDLKPAIERLLADEQVVTDLLPLSPSPSEKTVTKAVRETSEPYLFPVVYLPPFFYSEIGISRRLKSLREANPLAYKGVTTPNLDLTLSPEQRHAVEISLLNPVSVLTGGPGTGKTTAVRSLISALEEAGKKYALSSPTGRAAKRLSEATNRPASTIHRLLGYSPLKGFSHHQKNPLPVDFLVVDETSMLDVILGNHLLKAIRPGTHLLLVGDVDQLPSVGAGDVLRDVIASG